MDNILTSLCYYDSRNPDCTADDEDIKDHKAQLLRVSKMLGYNKTSCSCDNCFYGRTELAEHILTIQDALKLAYDAIGDIISANDDRLKQFKKP